MVRPPGPQGERKTDEISLRPMIRAQQNGL